VSVLTDVRYALRQLRKNPGFTAVAVMTLALGIAANSTIFSWINATLLDPIPGAARPREMVSIMRGERVDNPTPPFSYLDYADLRAQNRSFSGLLAYHDGDVALTGDGQPQRTYGVLASANYFDVLGVRAFLGRTFLPSEEQAQGSASVVVIGYGLWQSRFAGDRSIVGKTLEINRHPFTIIGVAPARFVGAKTALKADLWVPLTGENNTAMFGGDLMPRRGSDYLQLLGRLKPGVSTAQAEREIDVLMQQIAQQYPDLHKGVNTISFDPLWRSPFGANVYFAKGLPILLALAGLVLLLACANVANLLLVRSMGMRRDIALRLAIGSDRWRLIRQFLAEGLLLSLAGGTAAILITLWTARAMMSFVPVTVLPIVLEGRVDGSVLLATLLFSLIACVVFGVLPALHASRLSPATVLKEDSGSGLRKGRLARALVVVQIALSFLLLICAGLFVRTLRNVESINPGFNPHNVLLASYELLPADYDETAGIEFHRQLMLRLAAIPGVESATISDWVPLAFDAHRDAVTPEGYVSQPRETMVARYGIVGPDYFRTMRIPLTEGREFTFQDTRESQFVAVVNQAFAARYWPQQEAMGKRVFMRNAWYTIVGVAPDTKQFNLKEPPSPLVYLPILQDYQSDPVIHLRTSGDPLSYLPQVKQAVREMNGNLPLFGVTTLQNSIRLSSVFTRITGILVGVFGMVALTLASVGLYGVVAYTTRQRTREIGVRMAVGARQEQVFRMVLLQGLKLTATGLAIGAALALPCARLVQSMLLEVSATDELTFITVGLILTAVGLIACWLPARRAMQVEPVKALRYE
jgi:predicted permease